MSEFLREALLALWRSGWWVFVLAKTIELGIIIALVIEKREELIGGRVKR